jgi:hypothetical protein
MSEVLVRNVEVAHRQSQHALCLMQERFRSRLFGRPYYRRMQELLIELIEEGEVLAGVLMRIRRSIEDLEDLIVSQGKMDKYELDKVVEMAREAKHFGSISELPRSRSAQYIEKLIEFKKEARIELEKHVRAFNNAARTVRGFRHGGFFRHSFMGAAGFPSARDMPLDIDLAVIQGI